MALTLEGIKVVEVGQVAAVPMTGQHLADFGAEVIHVEHPVTGDSLRAQGPWISASLGLPPGRNPAYETYNRNKKSLTLDVSQKRGQDVLHRLVEKADVFQTNMRPSELERYNMGYQNLNKTNSGLIYASLNGYGKEGAEKDLPGYDFTAYWARSGCAHMVPKPGTPPDIPLDSFGDVIAGMGLAFGIVLALLEREKTGRGQEVDVNLYQMGVYQATSVVSGNLFSGNKYEKWRRECKENPPNPMVGAYETEDGRWLFLCFIQPDRYWHAFCEAIERKDLEYDSRFNSTQSRVEHNIMLLEILKEVFQNKPLSEWKIRLRGFPFDIVQTPGEVVQDPQARANHFFVPFEHPNFGLMDMQANPINLRKTPAAIRTAAPEFGQHTEEILLEYGYEWEDIEQLKDAGVIA